MSNDLSPDKAVAVEWCPTQGGTGSAWEPQWRPLDSRRSREWQRVPYALVVGAPTADGVPFPVMHGGAIQQIGLCGYEQAMALAWRFTAECVSRGEHVEVRVCEYELQFEIKARKRDLTGKTITDGFGNVWEKCGRPDCGMELVRPGKIQCDHEECAMGKACATTP